VGKRMKSPMIPAMTPRIPDKDGESFILEEFMTERKAESLGQTGKITTA
jgi:hypothetical protein